jgi:hypothetical protein
LTTEDARNETQMTTFVEEDARNETQMTTLIETVATVLKREAKPTIHAWLKRVEKVAALTKIHLSDQERTGHLPQLLQDLVTRLGLEKDAERPATTSAHDHGRVRFNQGYSVPMLVEESRLLQVSIFDTLRSFQKSFDPELMMDGVVTIADECDAQLKHTVETFMKLEKPGHVSVA